MDIIDDGESILDEAMVRRVFGDGARLLTSSLLEDMALPARVMALFGQHWWGVLDRGGPEKDAKACWTPLTLLKFDGYSVLVHEDDGVRYKLEEFEGRIGTGDAADPVYVLMQ